MKKVVYISVLLLLGGFIACSDDGDTTTQTDPTYCTVIFDSQGAETVALPSNMAVVSNNSVVSLPSSPVKANNLFAGWFTAINGGGVSFTVDTLITNDITVYAKWVGLYSVAYNGNGNSSGIVPVDSGEYTNGQSVSVLSNSGNLLKINVDGDSYKFMGWTNSSGEVVSNSFSMGSADVVLSAKWVSYIVGDVGPASGWVFYDKGSYSGSPEWRYLEAAPSDITYCVWGKTNYSVSGADGLSIGDGWQNSIDITNSDGTSDKAVDSCLSLQVNTGGINYSDWYLPSRDELICMVTNLSALGTGNFSDTHYWSSTEADDNNAYRIQYPAGGIAAYKKDNQLKSRAIRQF